MTKEGRVWNIEELVCLDQSGNGSEKHPLRVVIRFSNGEEWVTEGDQAAVVWEWPYTANKILFEEEVALWSKQRRERPLAAGTTVPTLRSDKGTEYVSH
jgi:hypothetical protein